MKGEIDMVSICTGIRKQSREGAEKWTFLGVVSSDYSGPSVGKRLRRHGGMAYIYSQRSTYSLAVFTHIHHCT